MKSRTNFIQLLTLVLVLTSALIEPAMAGRGYVYNHDQMFSYYGSQFDIEGEKVGERGHEYTRDVVYVRPEKNVNLGDPEIACKAIKIIREKASENGMPAIAELTDYEMMGEFAGRGNKIVIIHVDLDEDKTPKEIDAERFTPFSVLKTKVGSNVVRDHLEPGRMLFFPDGEYAYTIYLKDQMVKEGLANDHAARRILWENRIPEMSTVALDFVGYYKAKNYPIKFDRTNLNIQYENFMHLAPAASGYEGNVTIPKGLGPEYDIDWRTKPLDQIVLTIDLDEKDAINVFFDGLS